MCMSLWCQQQIPMKFQVHAMHWDILHCKYTVLEKKETKTFFVIFPTKLGRFWWNLVHCFPDKFASNWCKRFPLHLNNVSTLPCETWNAHCAHATVELLQKETPEFIPFPPQLRPPNSPDLNPVDNSMWEMLQEKVYKTRITALELSTMLLTNGFCSDDIAHH